MPAPEFRLDPLSGRWVILAPDRAERPHDVDQAGGAPRPCPFCEGGEVATPHEILAIRGESSATDGRGWRVRVIPNKYPALCDEGGAFAFSQTAGAAPGVGVHEVILESPRHLRSTTEQSPAELAEVLSVYRARLAVLRQDSRWRYATIFKNVGAAAGASLEHLHSQLVAMPLVPTSIEKLLAAMAADHAESGRCYYCDLLNHELADGRRIVLATADFVAFCPAAARFPFETWLFPRRHQANYSQIDAGQTPRLAECLLDVLRRLETCLHRPAYNYLLRTSPFHAGDHYHWHIEIFPRITTLAGFELSTDLFINIVLPEDAAARLRAATIA